MADMPRRELYNDRPNGRAFGVAKDPWPLLHVTAFDSDDLAWAYWFNAFTSVFLLVHEGLALVFRQKYFSLLGLFGLAQLGDLRDLKKVIRFAAS